MAIGYSGKDLGLNQQGMRTPLKMIKNNTLREIVIHVLLVMIYIYLLVYLYLVLDCSIDGYLPFDMFTNSEALVKS